MAGLADNPTTETTKPRTLAAFPWREMLVANGIVSLLLGLAALLLVNRYSVDAHNWAQAASPDEFARVARLAVLLYILYALALLGTGMLWLAVSLFSSSRRRGIAGESRSVPVKHNQN